jgi:hypothetical protein
VEVQPSFCRGGVVALSVAAGNDPLLKQALAVLPTGNQVDVTNEANNQYPLPGIALLLGMFEHIQQFSALNGHHHYLETEISLGQDLGFAGEPDPPSGRVSRPVVLNPR